MRTCRTATAKKISHLLQISDTNDIWSKLLPVWLACDAHACYDFFTFPAPVYNYNYLMRLGFWHVNLCQMIVQGLFCKQKGRKIMSQDHCIGSLNKAVKGFAVGASSQDDCLDSEWWPVLASGGRMGIGDQSGLVATRQELIRQWMCER